MLVDVTKCDPRPFMPPSYQHQWHACEPPSEDFQQGCWLGLLERSCRHCHGLPLLRVEGEQLGQLTTNKGDSQGGEDAGGTEVEEGRLGGLEGVHDDDGGCQAEDVGHEAGVKVVLPEAVLLDSKMLIKSQAQGNKDTRNDNITQTKQGKVPMGGGPVEDVLGEEEFDWDIKRFCHFDHDIRPKHPKDVIDKRVLQGDRCR